MAIPGPLSANFTVDFSGAAKETYVYVYLCIVWLTQKNVIIDG